MSEFRAKKGGQVGINGEFYQGGQFLPSSEATVKGAHKAIVRKGKKAEVAPYVWAEAPADDMLSIYERIRYWVDDNRDECEYVKGAGFVGFRLVFVAVRVGEMVADTTRYTPEGDWVRVWVPEPPERVEYIGRMVERYNAGERWFHVSEDLYHWSNNL